MPIETIIATAGLVLAAVTFIIGRVTAGKNDGKEIQALSSDIGYLKSNTDDIKRRLDKLDERYIGTATRLTAVEASAKQAHKRIDALEKGIQHEEA